MNTVSIIGRTVMPNSITFIDGDEYRSYSGEEPSVGDAVLITFPCDDTAKNVNGLGICPVALIGRVAMVDENDVVHIATENRLKYTCYDEENDCEDDEPYLSPCRDIDDIREDESSESKQRIKQMLEPVKSKYAGWYSIMDELLDTGILPEYVLSMPPLCMYDPERGLDILAEDSIKRRTEMTESYIRGAVSSGMLDKLLYEAALQLKNKAVNSKTEKTDNPEMSELDKLETKIKGLDMNDEAAKEVGSVLGQLRRIPEYSNEYGTLINYVKYCSELPWKKEPFTATDIGKARNVLDKEHYGIKKVKERMIEALAVMALTKKHSGTILCLVGAPGTGKTSVCKSIAKAMGRKYARVALGGVSDEAEIRGHRRTYMGSMPGRIIDAMKKCGTTNPVIVLDEIDKLCESNKGDPSAALLEVLDPEQNSTFTDHYLNFPYDLSDVMFICTANSLDTIPAPLLSRMEIIKFDNYTQTEKLHIATEYLLPQEIERNGLPKTRITVTDEALTEIISGYTAEGGVRGLRKHLSAICRRAAVKRVSGDRSKIVVTKENLGEYLDGHALHSEKALDKSIPGVVTGLAWTQVGGKILLVESKLVPGNGKVITTGQLGDVFKESAQVAISLVKSLYPDKADMFDKNDLHIHLPEGAVPKDGPSAGIALTSALASLVTGKAVDSHTAMTGEISLRGAVTAIGGLPEKLWGAKQAGITKVLIPKENVDDLADVPAETKEGLTIIPVSEISEVLKNTGIACA